MVGDLPQCAVLQSVSSQKDTGHVLNVRISTRDLKNLALILIPVLLQYLWDLDEKLPLSYAGDITQTTLKI
jgi:hypothetical protein